MRLRLMLAALLLTTAAPVLHAQRPAACDSTIAVDQQLASTVSVHDDLSEWVPAHFALPPLFERPQPANQNAIGRELIRSYPAHLRDRGIGGEVTFALLIDSAGAVTSHRLLESSSRAELDDAATGFLGRIRYAPVRIEAGCAVPAVLRFRVVYRSKP